MATTKKIIGSVPIYRGEYTNGETYYKQNIVSYIGSAFISSTDGNTEVPCTVEKDKFVLGEGWGFFIDNSEMYFKVRSEIDIQQDVFDEMKEQGLLDTTKVYYTYEEES